MTIGEINKHGKQIQACKGPDCGAEIFFLAVPRGSMPVDAQPVDDGTARVYWHDGRAYADVMADERVRDLFYPGETWYRPHWAICPNADDFRERDR